LKKIVVKPLGVDEREVSPSARFINNLGADSLDLLELIMSTEECFGTLPQKVSIPDEGTEKMVTIQDTTGYLKDKCISSAAPVKKSNDQSKNQPPVSKRMT
jgi:acyl carrier protein